MKKKKGFVVITNAEREKIDVYNKQIQKFNYREGELGITHPKLEEIDISSLPVVNLTGINYTQLHLDGNPILFYNPSEGCILAYFYSDEYKFIENGDVKKAVPENNIAVIYPFLLTILQELDNLEFFKEFQKEHIKLEVTCRNIDDFIKKCL